MTKHKILAAGALATLAIAGLSACGDDPQAASGDDASSYAAVIKGLDNPFFQQMEQGIDAQAKADDVSVEIQAAQSITDTTGQADKLDAMAQQGYGCYIVNPISGTNLIQGLARIAAQDTPVVNIDSPIEADAAKKADLEVTTYIGTDNTEAGKLGGDAMIEALGGSGTVALIGGISGDPTSGARIDGFTSAVDGTLKTLPVVSADWDRQIALTKATDILSANKDVTGFFAANDDMALGIARAVANADRTGEIKIISVDGVEDALKAVEAGDLYATVAQYPYAIDQMGVQACQKATAGDDLPENITAPVAVVTKDEAGQALEKFPAPFKAFDNPLD
ncbi:MAG: substrate-binding domain-containing protein [Nocardioides sp.]